MSESLSQRESEQAEQEKHPVAIKLPEEPELLERIKKLPDMLEKEQESLTEIIEKTKIQEEIDDSIKAQSDLFYTQTVLNKMINFGSVDYEEFKQEMKEKSKNSFDEKAYDDAFKYIEAYANSPSVVKEIRVEKQKELKGQERQEPINPFEEQKKQDAEKIEISPFQEQENKIIGNIIKKSAEGVKISDTSKKVIDGFLAKDADEAYREFALAWFDDHKEDIQKEKGIPIGNVSDDWKISMVLGSREKGGMEAGAEIRGEDYKAIGDDIEKIGILREDIKEDIKKDQLPLETPFLLLNYLQASINREKENINILKVKASTGNEGASIEADSKEKGLEELFLAQKELAEKIMGEEDLNKTAEQKLTERGFPTKEKNVQENIDEWKKYIENKKDYDLREKEWQDFSMLSKKDKKIYREKIGYKEYLTRDEFNKSLKENPADSLRKEDPDKMYEKYNFLKSIMSSADNFGKRAFYGLLEQGYKPYEKQEKGFLPKKFFIPKKDGGFIEKSAKEYGAEIKKFEDEHIKDIEPQAKKELEDAWDKEHDEKARAEIEKRIKELSQSSEFAEGGLEKAYKNARERIVAEFNVKYLAEHPQEKTPAEQKELDNKFGEGKIKNKKEKTEKITDVLFKLSSDTVADENGELIGSLKGLTGFIEDDAVDLSHYFKENLGVEEMTPGKLKKIMAAEGHKKNYKAAFKEKFGLFDWFVAILTDKPWKTKPKNKKIEF